jgi:hypothetical protein
MTIRPILFLEDMTGYEVSWAFGFPLPAEQTAAEFYKYSSSYVCEVKKDGFAVDIYLDGEMRYHSKDKEVSIYDGGDMMAAGYTTDKIFTDAVEAEELQHINNPWFDLYVRGEHLDSVSHDINEALLFAKHWLEEEISNAKEIENFGVSPLDLPA